MLHYHKHLFLNKQQNNVANLTFFRKPRFLKQQLIEVNWMRTGRSTCTLSVHLKLLERLQQLIIRHWCILAIVSPCTVIAYTAISITIIQLINVSVNEILHSVWTPNWNHVLQFTYRIQWTSSIKTTPSSLKAYYIMTVHSWTLCENALLETEESNWFVIKCFFLKLTF